jgi:hypothetical protein
MLHWWVLVHCGRFFEQVSRPSIWINGKPQPRYIRGERQAVVNSMDEWSRVTVPMCGLLWSLAWTAPGRPPEWSVASPRGDFCKAWRSISINGWNLRNLPIKHAASHRYFSVFLPRARLLWWSSIWINSSDLTQSASQENCHVVV